MSDERWVVLGLAHPRATWFSDLAIWATAAMVPVDFVKCVSAEEARARLGGGRPFSAVLVGGDLGALDRDLIGAARAVGAVVIVVDPVTQRDWNDLGVSAVLARDFDRGDLMAALDAHAQPIAHVDAHRPEPPAAADGSWRGRMVAVTGPGGTGTSITAMALAQILARDASDRGLIALADFALHAELAMLHDARELIPGLQELTEAHRTGRLPITEVRKLLFDCPDHGYHLLLGLRRHRDWTAIRPRAFDAALDGLLRSYRWVVADVDPEVEGDDETGSVDVEDRNLIARATHTRADLVVIVGSGSPKGLHALGRTTRDLSSFGVAPERLMIVINKAPRNPRTRAAITRALAEITSDIENHAWIDNPTFLPLRGDIDDAIRDGRSLPNGLLRPLRNATQHRLARLTRTPEAEPIVEPALVTPGSLGRFHEESS